MAYSARGQPILGKWPVPRRRSHPHHRIPTYALQAGLAHSDLSIEQLWFRYIALGGVCSMRRLAWEVYDDDLPAIEHDRIAQALNEYFLDRDVTQPVAYSEELDDT